MAHGRERLRPVERGVLGAPKPVKNLLYSTIAGRSTGRDATLKRLKDRHSLGWIKEFSYA